MTVAAPAPTHPLPNVTAEQARFFVEQGYLVMPGLIQADELEALRRDTAHIARGGYPCKSIQPMPATVTDDQVLERLLCIHNPHGISPVMRRFIDHPAIAAVLTRIVAAHLPAGWWNGAVKCMQSMLFVKPPAKPGQAWHQDEMYIPTRDRSLCGAWIAMDDATIENGCLWILPGSHRPGYIYPSKAPTDLVEYDGSFQCYGFDDSGAVPVEVKAGSVVFFNGYVLHKSLRNRTTATYRRALVNHYMNSTSLLHWPDAGAGDNRCVIQVAGSDPYAWKGYIDPGNDVYLREYGKAWGDDKGKAGDPA